MRLFVAFVATVHVEVDAGNKIAWARSVDVILRPHLWNPDVAVATRSELVFHFGPPQ